MLAAFSFSINELRELSEDHDKRLAGLQSYIEGKLPNPQEPEQFRYALKRLQSEVRSNSFRLNDLTCKCRQMDQDFNRIKQDVDMLMSRCFGSNLPENKTLPQWNITMGFSNRQFRPIENGNINAVSETFDSSKNLQGQVSGSCLPEPCTQGQLGVNNNGTDRMRSLWENRNKTTECGVPENNKNNLFGLQFGDPFQHHTTDDQDNCASLREHLIQCHRRLGDLEQLAQNQIGIIQDLSCARDTEGVWVEDHIKKLEWYENKMRLLKQDKRRRGETIGKLIRVIDAMRDAGRLNLAVIVEGRAVINATLQSRGMLPDDRIVTIINAMETQKSPRNRPESTATNTVCSSSTDASCEVSSQDTDGVTDNVCP